MWPLGWHRNGSIVMSVLSRLVPQDVVSDTSCRSRLRLAFRAGSADRTRVKTFLLKWLMRVASSVLPELKRQQNAFPVMLTVSAIRLTSRPLQLMLWYSLRVVLTSLLWCCLGVPSIWGTCVFLGPSTDAIDR